MRTTPFSLERLRRHAAAPAAAWDALDFTSPVDRALPFLCETVTPLYYAPIYQELAAAHRLRYNQLMGLAFGELICFFESQIAVPLLESLVARPGELPEELAAALQHFAADERRHTAAFRALNRLAEPGWYAASDQFLVPSSAFGERAIRFLARHPAHFPAILWIGLLMEEKALATSRALLTAKRIEPHFLAVYRQHLRDEVRHVELDWHLLGRLYEGQPRWRRELNARFFCFLLDQYFLAPIRAGRRVTERWLAEFPELLGLRGRILREMAALGQDPAYQRMMYSRRSTPIAFALFDRYPEFRRLTKVLSSYVQEPAHVGD